LIQRRFKEGKGRVKTKNEGEQSLQKKERNGAKGGKGETEH